MRIAVIVPYHNAEKWLERCLASVDNHLDLITVDDHSTDKSREIADDYYTAIGCSASISVYSSLGGVSRARNDGLLHALKIADEKPDYITFLDADDEYTSDAFEVMRDAIKAYPNADIIQFNHLREIDGRRWSKFYNKTGDRGLHKLPGFWVGVWNKLYKADLLKGLSFIGGLNHGEDEIFNLEALAKARMITCVERQTVIHHFDNTQSLSKTTDFDDLISEQHALLNFLEEHYNDPELCEAVRMRQLELWDNPTYKQIFGGET